METQVIEGFLFNAVDQQGIAGCGSARPGFGCGLIDGHEAKCCRYVTLHESITMVRFPADHLVGGGYDGSGSRLRHDGLEGAAGGLGEGEGGLVVEGGQEVFAAAGHHEGVAAGGVAHGVVAVDGAEVVRRVGRGGDADGQAFHDAVGAVTGLSDAVGHLGLGAGGRAGDGPIVGTSPFKFARIIAAVFEGTADADSDPIVASVAYAHAFVHLVVCIDKGDIGIIAEGGVVGKAAGGDGKRPAISGDA